MLNTHNADDHLLTPETEIVSRQRLWLEVKLCEVYIDDRTEPLVGGPHVVITMRLTNKPRSNY